MLGLVIVVVELFCTSLLCIINLTNGEAGCTCDNLRAVNDFCCSSYINEHVMKFIFVR